MPVTGTPSPEELEAQLLALFRAFGGVGAPTTLTLPWTPHPKARPRFTRQGRAYHDPRDKDAEQKTRAMLLYKTPTRLEANVCVVAAFCRHDRRSLDGDNLLKHLLDAANNVLFYDDAQVTASGVLVEYDPVHPRTVLMIGEHASSMPRVASAARRAKPRGA